MAKVQCNQEIPQDQSFLDFYQGLPEKSSTTIRFFARSDYYTVHGSDATFIAKKVFKSLSVVKTMGPQNIDYVCLSKLNFESILKDLLFVQQYRVEIYQNQGSGRSQSWQLESKASPGNFMQLEELLFGNENFTVGSKGVIAVKIKPNGKDQVIGIAFGDAVLREFKITEFIDNSFALLEAVVVQLCPKECLLCLSTMDIAITNEITEILKRNCVLLTECKASDFNSAALTQDLTKLLESNDVSNLGRFEEDYKNAIQCLAPLIKYFELLSDESNYEQYALSSFNPKLYMMLDSSAVKALGIISTSNEDVKSHSLFGLLNRCRTPQGQRLLGQWIKQPLLDLKKIDQRLDVVQSLVNDTELRQMLFENYLRKIPDLHILAKKIQRKKADLQDLYKIYMMINQLPGLLTCLTDHSGQYSCVIQTLFCTDIQERIDDLSQFQEMMKTVVDLEAVEEGEFIIKSDCDPKLKELRDLMKKSQDLIGREIDKVASDLCLEANKTLKLENCRQIGYYFRITRKEEKALRMKKSYFMIDTKQNGVRFYNASLKELNTKYLTLRNSYEKYQNKVVEQLMDVAVTYCSPLKLLGETIAQLDVLVAFACAAFSAPKPYVRPKLLESNEKCICLKQARHPCIETQPNITFIPNDIKMEKEKHMFHIITGPNMGGKSTFIRSIALNILMAQIGSFVPCDKADVSVVDAILTRVGAGDKPIKGVSTFMAEMLEVKHILKTATLHSFIVVDELGRGTSTYDGLGLAWALSEYIAKTLRSYCLFTTHFHELSTLSNDITSVNNLHVTAITSGKDITFLYQVKPGVCDQSFGIHVAQMAHFPSPVVDFAIKKLQELEASSFEVSKDKPPVKKKKTN